VHLKTIVRNVFSNWASYLVTAVVGFSLSPFILHRLGNTGYGLWTLVLSLTGYFGLLDLGIRSSVGRFVVRYVTLHDEENVNRTVSSAFAILACAGALALLVTTVLVAYFFGSFHVEPQYQESGKLALWITGINMACILPLSVFSSVLIALERYDILSGVTMLMELVRAALVVACLRNGYGLVGLAFVALFITAAQYSAMAILVKSLYRPLRLGLRFVDRETIQGLFGFGIYRFLWIISNQVIFYSDSIVIGVFLGASAITPFAIAGSLINYGRNIVSLATDTCYPSAIRMDASKDLAGLQRLLIMGTRMTLLLALPICFGFVFLGRQFITLWMGNAYASSAVFLTVLALAQFSAMPQYVSVNVLSGMAKHRTLAYLVFAEGLANLILSIILVRKIGLVGVAWGTVIPNLISTMVIVPLYTLRMVNLGWREYLRGAFLRPLACAVPLVALGSIYYLYVDHATWLIFVSEVLLMCGAFGIMSFFFCFDASHRAAARDKVWSLLHRELAVHEV
jgi:O-antigen/teichoic acid export membrane protein